MPQDDDLYETFRQDSQQQAYSRILAASYKEGNPDDAGEAVRLAEETGSPPGAVLSNLDSFRQGYKNQLSSELLWRNKYIQDYVNSHDLAADISHDSIGQMDNASFHLSNLMPDGAVKRWLTSDEFHRGFGEFPVGRVPSPVGAPMALPLEVMTRAFRGAAFTIPSFRAGYGEAPIGLSDFLGDEKSYQLARDYPMYAAVHGAARMPVELMGRNLGGLLHLGRDALAVAIGDKAANELAAMLEWRMMSGDVHVTGGGGGAGGIRATMEKAPLREAIRSVAEKEGMPDPWAAPSPPISGPQTEQQKRATTILKIGNNEFPLREMDEAFNDVKGAIEVADPYLKEGKEPPPDINPTLDDIKKQEIREDLKKLDDAHRAVWQDPTRERAPDLYDKNFVRNHIGDRQIGIDAAAIRKLYGDKSPMLDDGILGHVTGLQDMLETAELYGGDVYVSEAEYLSKVDKDVHKELREFIRPREGGRTLDEIKPVEGEVAKPKEVIPDPVTLVRGGAGLEPMFSAGDRKVTIRRKADVKRTQFEAAQGFHDFDLIDEKGQEVGTINLFEQEDGKLIYIEMIQAGPKEKKFYDPNFLGPSLIMSIGRQLKAEFPKAFGPDGEGITGHRVSGARGKAGTWEEAHAMPKVKFEAGDDIQRFRDLLNAHWEDVGQGVTALFGTPEQGLAAASPMGQMVLSTLRRLAPGAKVSVAHGLIGSAGEGLRGVYLPEFKSIIVSLENPDPLGTARHEPMHFLKHLFTPEEWANLEASSLEHGWMKKYEVEKRWGHLGLTPAHKVEESIAEAYRYWRHNGEAVPKEVETLFQRIKQFFDELLAKVAKHLGIAKPESWEDIFAKIESGEVGGRGQERIRDQLDSKWRWMAEPADEAEPPLAPGKIRFYHGTAYEDAKGFTGKTFVTPSRQYARDYHGGPNNVLYTDFTKQEAIDRGLYDEINEYPRHGPIDDGAERLKPLSAGQPSAPLVVARKMPDGTTRIGKPGQIHADLVDKDASPLSVSDDQMGFARADGKFMTRDEATAFLDKEHPELSSMIGGRRELNRRQIEAGQLKAALAPKEEGPPTVPSIFEKGQALGVTQAHMKQMLENVRERNIDDFAKNEKRILKEKQRKASKEWKQRRTELRDEVRTQLSQRSDLAADEFFSKGVVKIHPDFLSAEQKSLLPKEYIQKKNGVDPDVTAKNFGYSSGTDLVNKLGLLTEDRRRAGMSFRDYLNRLIDIETDRRLNDEFSGRGAKDMAEGRDQALSETGLNIVHQDTLLYALAAKIFPKFTKEQVTDMARQRYDHKTTMAQVDSSRILQTVGKVGKKIEEAGAKDNWAEAYRLSQQRQFGALFARFAVDTEKAMEQFDRVAGMFRDRERKSVAQEYTNWIHVILARFGRGSNEFSAADLAERLGRFQEQSLAAFVAAKEAEFGGQRQLPVADFLLDDNFKKTSIDQLTPWEFMGLKQTIDGLYKAGRDEKKVYNEGQTYDRQVLIAKLVDKLENKFGLQPPPGRGLVSSLIDIPKKFLAGSLAMETILHRFDGFDKRGDFKKFLSFPLASSAGHEFILQKQAAKILSELPRLETPDKLVTAPFPDPRSRSAANGYEGTGPWEGFNDRMVQQMVFNAGNKSNWELLARGFGKDPAELMRWLELNSTKAHWDRAQQLGDTVFQWLVKMSADVYERIEGVPFEKIPLEPFTNRHGTFAGYYFPAIRDPIRKLVWKQDPESGNWISTATGKPGLPEDRQFFSHLSSNGYTKKRTGAFYPLELESSVLPSRIMQIIHDIAFRENLLETGKIMLDPHFFDGVAKHYSPIYAKMFEPYLKGVAGAQSISDLASTANTVSDYIRSGAVGTYINLAPSTPLKHGPTAWAMSAREVGIGRFLRATKQLYLSGPTVTKGWHEFVNDTFEEVARRRRHWDDTIAGERAALLGLDDAASTFERVQHQFSHIATWMVAKSDELSSTATALAEFDKRIEQGVDPGEAIDLANYAVRRAHGTTAITNLPAMVRGAGPIGKWAMTLYGFMGTIMQRRVETLWKIADTNKLVGKAQLVAASKKLPENIADLAVYFAVATYVEEKVTGLWTEDERGLMEHLIFGTFLGLSRGALFVRDFLGPMLHGHPPGYGMFTSADNELYNLINDISKGTEALSPKHAGKTVGDTLTVLSILNRGMPGKTVSKAAGFGIDWATGEQVPETPGELFRGTTRGNMRERVVR